MPVKKSKSCAKKGPTGPTGIMGKMGFMGPTGSTGLVGEKGPTGYGGDKYQTIISFEYFQIGAKQGNLWSQDISYGETEIKAEPNLSFVPGTKVVITPIPDTPITDVKYFALSDNSKNVLIDKQWHGTIVFYDDISGGIDIKNDGNLNPSFDSGMYKKWSVGLLHGEKGHTGKNGLGIGPVIQYKYISPISEYVSRTNNEIHCVDYDMSINIMNKYNSLSIQYIFNYLASFSSDSRLHITVVAKNENKSKETIIIEDMLGSINATGGNYDVYNIDYIFKPIEFGVFKDLDENDTFIFELKIKNENIIPIRNPSGGIINPYINTNAQSVNSINSVILKEINEDGKNEYEKIKQITSSNKNTINYDMQYQSEQNVFIKKDISAVIEKININNFKKNYNLSLIFIQDFSTNNIVNNVITISNNLFMYKNDSTFSSNSKINASNIFDASDNIFPISTTKKGDAIKLNILYSEPYYYRNITYYK